MTDLDLDRIEALCNAATPGPWEVNSMTHDSDVGDYTVYGIKDVDDATMTYDDSPAFAHTMGMDEADAVFIAGTGPDVVKELVRQLREARQERDKATRAVQTYSRVIEQQCTDVLNATGAHHLIQEDGDGDWMGVLEIMHELCQKGKAAEHQANIPADDMEIINGWLVHRGAFEPEFIPGAGCLPDSDAEPLLDLTVIKGWPNLADTWDEGFEAGEDYDERGDEPRGNLNPYRRNDE